MFIVQSRIELRWMPHESYHQVRAFCRGKLAHFKIPRSIKQVDVHDDTAADADADAEDDADDACFLQRKAGAP